MDVYDALTTDRSYHRAVALDQAIAELRRGASQGRFRADLIDTFLETLQSAA